MPFEDEFRERPRGFWLREMFGVFLLFWMVLLLMSLLSYSPSDPSLNHAMSRGKVTNLGGLLGAYTAGFLNDLFGSGSLLLPLLLGGIGLGFLSQRLALTWWRWLGCALTSFSVLVFLAALDVHIGDLQAGGMLGAIIYHASKSLLSPFGAALLWLFLLFVGVQLFVDLPWRRIVDRLGTFFSRFVVRDEDEEEDGERDRGDFILMEDENRPRAARLRKMRDNPDAEEEEDLPEDRERTGGIGLRVLKGLKTVAGRKNRSGERDEDGFLPVPVRNCFRPLRLAEEDIPFASCESSDVPMDHSYAEQYAPKPAFSRADAERKAQANRGRVRVGKEKGAPLLELLEMEEGTRDEKSAMPAFAALDQTEKDVLFAEDEADIGMPDTRDGGREGFVPAGAVPAGSAPEEDGPDTGKADTDELAAETGRAAVSAPASATPAEAGDMGQGKTGKTVSASGLPASAREIEPDDDFRLFGRGVSGSGAFAEEKPLHASSRAREMAALFGGEDDVPLDMADDALPWGGTDRQAAKAGPAKRAQARDVRSIDLGSARVLDPVVNIPEPLAPDLDEPDMEDEEDDIPQRPARPEIVRSKAPEPAVTSSRSVSRDGLFLPPLELLQKPEGDQEDLEVQDEELEECEDSLMGCLGDFGIQAELVRATPGPVVTTYMLRPAPGVSVRAFVRHTEDIARALMAVSVFIQAPVPGTDTVGIVIPNRTRAMVNFREIAENAVFAESGAALPLIVGKDTTGQPFVSDLAKMPHLLVAGATGQGKSVCLNAMLTSLLLRKTPAELKLLLVDPKRVEMGIYEDESHLVHPVVKEVEDAKNALLWAVREMDQRYSQMSRLYTKNIQGYNAKLASYKGNLPPELADLAPMPYIVIVIDELADLMLQARKDVEPCIIRLAQLARACGIHMIIATQRPSVDVVTGLIKANFPSRICFRVSSRQDSITTLGQAGAEKLLGNGDMFFNPNGGHLIRLHGPFLRDEEVQSVVDFWKKQVKPNYQVDFATFGQEEEESAPSGKGSVSSQDAMYQDVIEFCREKGHVSISLLQRRFNIGFNKAARYMDQLDRDGLVGPSPGAGKPRPVLIR